MRGLFKTLFGDRQTLVVAADCIIIAVFLLRTPAAFMAGLVFPLLLLGAAAYLAKR